MMNDFDRTLELIEESQNSAGAAAEQYAIYQDSAAAATARLTAAWEEFYSKIVNSEQIIWVINALEKLVETMSKIGPVATAIGTTVGALGLNLLGKAFIPKITEGLATVASSGQAASLSIGAIVKGGGALLVTFGKVAVVVGAVSIAIYGLIKAGQWLYNQFHQDEIAAKNLANSIRELDKDLTESNNKTASLEELLKKYEELTKKIYLTDEEQKELNSTIEKIASISDNAITYIDSLGNAHIRNKEAIKQELAMEKERQRFLAQQQMNNLSNLGNFRDVENLKTAGFTTSASYLENYSYRTGGIQQIKNNKSDVQNLKRITATLMDFDRLQYLPGELIRDIIEKLQNQFTELNFSEINTKEQLEELLSNSIETDITPILNEIGNIVEEYYNKILSETESLQEFNFEDIFNQELTSKIYNNMKMLGETESILANALQEAGVTFTLNTMDNLNDLLSEIGKDNLKKIEPFLKQYENGEIGVDDLLKKIKDNIDELDDAIEQHVQEITTKAAEEIITEENRRRQFIQDNQDFFNQNTDSRWRKDFIFKGDITDSEYDKMNEIMKSNLLNSEQKVTLFDMLAGSEDDLDKNIDNYIEKINQGLYEEADKIRNTIAELLGGDQKLAQKVIDTFLNDIESIAEKRLSTTEGNYKTARSIYEKDPQEALTDKEYEFLQGQNINIDRYIEINEEGEKYLNILGKISVLEKNRAQYATALYERIEANKTSIEEENRRLEEGDDLAEDQKNQQEALNQTHHKNIQNLESENELLEKQLKNLIDIVDETAAMSLSSNLSQAEQTYNNIEKIGKALGEAKQNAGQLSFATAQSLLALDDAYYEYIKITDGMVTLDAEAAEKMTEHEKQKYENWLEAERNKLEGQKILLQSQLDLINAYLAEEDAEKREQLRQQLLDNQNKINQELKDEGEGSDKSIIQNADMLARLQSQWEEYYRHLALADAAFKQGLTEIQPMSPEQVTKFFRTAFDKSSITKQSIKVGEIDFTITDEDKFRKNLQEEAERIAKKINLLDVAISQLDNLSPAFKEAFSKGLSEAAKGGEKAVKDVTKAIKDLLKALEDLDRIIKDVKVNLRDISVEYNPFTNLFEAWEHEWDYYYNIKRLIQQIETQGKYIDNIISADYTSAQQKIDTYHAKVGNLTASISANDTYIQALRAGMSQTGAELMTDFGQYYKINPETGQIYQSDNNLQEINNAINQARQELYDLQKFQNEKENNLSLENAKLEALEEEKTAYEDILSTIESQIDSLSNDEDIIADLSQLQSEQSSLKTKIEISDSSIEAAKDKIRGMEDEIQEVEIQITLKESEVSKAEDYVGHMEDKVSEYEEYWNTLNETIAGQQELLQQLSEIHSIYVDIAVDTEKQLYNAIVENYQNEINQKKKEYDTLKQLDNDYLESVRESINKERRLREEVNKQRSYQNNIQRAQLLQMDTSGAYRSELANLNKEIQNQRQDLYDDLVDKQVEALEKELENRHELYDKEVAALEERLAFYQENAILLWEKVNSIVAQGSEAMMAMLMNTTQYMQSSELEKQQLRNTWENNVAITYDAVQEKTISFLENLIQYGQDYIITQYPEIGAALEEYTDVYSETRSIIEQYNEILNQYNINMDAYNIALEAYYTALNKGASALEAYNEALKAAGEVLGVSAEEAGRLLGLSFEEISEQLTINMQTMAFNLGIGMEEATSILNGKLQDIANEFDTNIDIISANLKLDFVSLGNDFLKVGDQYISLNTRLMELNTEVFKQVLDTFMTQWNDKSHKFTTYAENWETTVEALKRATEENIQSLKDLNKNYEGDIAREMNKIPGSIGSFIDKINEVSKNMYNDFITERNKYRDELESLITEIRNRISAAIQSAANAISNAASSISAAPSTSTPTNSSSTPTNSNSTSSNSSSTSSNSSGGNRKIGFKYYINPNDGVNGVQQLTATHGGTEAELWAYFVNTLIPRLRKTYPNATFWGFQSFLKGGLANYTGPAWLDGTKSNPERILSPRQTKLFESMVSSLEKSANNSTINSGFNSSYNIGEINTTIKVDKLDNQTDINKLVKQVEDKIVKDIRNRVSVSINKGV